MPSHPGIRDYVPSLAAAVVGVSTAFVLFRRNPVASIVSYSGGNFDIIAASLVVGAPLFLLIATKRFPYPDKWALASLLGGGWAALFVGMNEGLGSAATVLFVVAVTLFAAFTSFFLPTQGKNFLLWGPSVLLLVHQFAITLLRGPLPGGFFGQGTGSIAFGHLMAIGFLVSYLLSKRSVRYHNVFFAGSAMFTIGVMLSGSRGALLGLVLAIALVHLRVFLRTGLSATSRELRRFTYGGFLTVFPFFLPNIFMPGRGFAPVIQRKLIETFELSEKVGSLEVPFYTAGRLEIWITTWQKFENGMDVLFGTGRSSVETIFGMTYPHNLFLELLLVGGLLTVVPFVLFLLALFLRMYNPAFDNRFEFFLLAMVTGVFSMFSGDLGYNIVFFYFLGLSYGQIRKQSGAPVWLGLSPRTRVPQLFSKWSGWKF